MNWWDPRERLGSEILSEVVDDSTNSEPGTMKGHITHVRKDVGVIRGADGAEYSFAIQDILANPMANSEDGPSYGRCRSFLRETGLLRSS